MLVNPTENYIDGCPSCRVIYVHDGGSGDGSGSNTKYRLYSDSRLINLLIKRTRENKLNWIPHKGGMYDHYPYTLEIEGAIFTVTYNGRNLELRMNWKYVEDPNAKDNYPKPTEPDSKEKNDDSGLDEPSTYVKDYVIISNQYTPKKYPPPVRYIKYTDEQIEAILDKWDYRKPYRNITSEWQPSIFELVEAIKVYCNSKYRETTHYVDRYKESRKAQIDYLEDLEDAPANSL